MTKCDVAPATNIVDSKISHDTKEEGSAKPSAPTNSTTTDKPATKPIKQEKPKTKKTEKPKTDKTKKADKPKTDKPKKDKADKKKKDKPWWEKAIEVGKEALPDIKEKAAPVLDKIKSFFPQTDEEVISTATTHPPQSATDCGPKPKITT